MVTIRLAQEIGPARARAWAARFGLDEARQPLNLTLALGTGSVTPMQMAQAYAVFANAGQLPTPWLIQRVTDAQGALLWQAEAPALKPAISARNAFMTAQLLAAVTREGTGARASSLLGRWDLYGKTGTTNDAVDAWFVGFQQSRVGAVWIGYPQPKSLGERETGGGLALPVWASTMAVALRGIPATPLTPPAEGLVQEAASGSTASLRARRRWRASACGWLQRRRRPKPHLARPAPSVSRRPVQCEPRPNFDHSRRLHPIPVARWKRRRMADIRPASIWRVQLQPVALSQRRKELCPQRNNGKHTYASQ